MISTSEALPNAKRLSSTRAPRGWLYSLGKALEFFKLHRCTAAASKLSFELNQPGTLDEQYWTVILFVKLNQNQICALICLVKFYYFKWGNPRNLRICIPFHRLLSRDFGGIETLQRGLNILPCHRARCGAVGWDWDSPIDGWWW